MSQKGKRLYLVRHFTAFLVLCAILGAIVLYVGSSADNASIASLGSAIFSAATVGTIFKVIGYDIYLKETLTEIITSSGFLKMLRETELKQHIKNSIAEIKQVTPSEDIYATVEKHLIDELAKIVVHNRSFNIVISNERGFGRNILSSTTTYSATLINESTKTLPLFPSFICKIATTIPRTMHPRNIPVDPREVTRFINMRVNDRSLTPDKEETEWADPSDKTKGVHCLVESNVQVEPRTPTSVTYTIKSLIDDSDYIIRRFMDFTKNASVTIHHPRGFEVKVVWFRTPDVTIHEPSVGPTTYSQRAEGVFLPGGGFIAILKRRSTR